MDKIYSRKRIKLPDIKYASRRENKKNDHKELRVKLKKISKVITVISIAMLVVWKTLCTIEPIINSECIVLAKNIAAKISNEEASNIMSNYKYEDLCSIERDNNR